MQLADLVNTSRDVAGTRSRLRKRAALAACLRSAAPGEVRLAVSYLAGTLAQGRIGLGPAVLGSLRGAGSAAGPSLSLRQVDEAFDAIGRIEGKGSQAARRDRLGSLFAQATVDEQDFLERLILGELRQGALESALLDAIADAATLPVDEVRRAAMLAGEPASVADAAFREGRAGLARFRLVPLSPIQPMLAQPAEDMPEALGDVAADLLVPRTVTGDPVRASGFLEAALQDGHEGVMAKSLTSPYAAGSRGAGWLKVKQAHTFDLVVLAAEWGSGRRKGWLSNLHLGARDPDTGGFVMLGKTFKGLTDRLLEWQTRELLAREIGREGPVVHVRPELVVEIAVNEIQASSHYPAGMALRFARVKRYRDDKAAADADTVDAVRALHLRQISLAAA